MADVLAAARERWHRSTELNRVRAEVDALLAETGRVAAVDELAARLLAARGSAVEDDAERLRRARAVLRATVELEAAFTPVGAEAARFAAHAEGHPVLVAATPEHAEYARRLGRAATALARQTPLPGTARVENDLGLVPVPDGVEALPPGRALRLAVAASPVAALSARLELYPRGLPAPDALRLALGALSGPEVLDAAEVQARVRGRFPEAEPLPDRPALDALLHEAGADREWRAPPGGKAGYHPRAAADATTGGATSLAPLRQPTHDPAVEATPEVLAARMLEEKLAHAARTGAFLALTVDPQRAAAARDEVVRRFPREAVSLERLVLRAMRAEAEARRVQWPVVLAADAAPRAGSEFKNLLRLAARAAPRVREAVLALRAPALLTRLGLLARYDLMDLLEGVAQASGAEGGPPSLWLLLPQTASGLPVVDGAVLPVISAANWARLTRAWLDNAHRAGGRSAA